MSFDFDNFDAIITETLAAGEHPETRRADTNATVDDDGNPRRSTLNNDALWLNETFPELQPLQQAHSLAQRWARRQLTTHALAELANTPGTDVIAYFFETAAIARAHLPLLLLDGFRHNSRLRLLGLDDPPHSIEHLRFDNWAYDHTIPNDLPTGFREGLLVALQQRRNIYQPVSLAQHLAAVQADEPQWCANMRTATIPTPAEQLAVSIIRPGTI